MAKHWTKENERFDNWKETNAKLNILKYQGVKESIWWLVSINLTSPGNNLTSRKIIYLTSRGDNSQNFVQKLALKQ